MPTTDDYGYGDLFDLLKLKSPAEKFLEFHGRNPHVLAAIEYGARRHVERLGMRRTSIDLLCHIARYERVLHVESTEEFKLPNQYTAFYARLLIHRHPEYAPLFVTRHSVADDSAWLGEAA